MTKDETRVAWGKRSQSSPPRESPTTTPTRTVATNARARVRRPRRGARVVVLRASPFLADEPNFSGPLMRSTRGDVRDHIDLHKRNHEPSYWS